MQIGQIFHLLYSSQQQSPSFECFKDKLKDKIKTGVIWLKDLCQLCELSLHTSLFSHVKKVLKQQRGSAIGNQISTSLANIAVSYLEHQWRQKHKDVLEKHSDELYIVRYVDNRLVLCGQHLAERWFVQEFLADFFYRHPVELEDVTNGEFLGNILDANLRTLPFQQPAASFQFRPFRSAGTEAHKLSAAAARICLASRYSLPDQPARSDVQQLVKSYLEYDYPATKLKQLANEFLQSRGWEKLLLPFLLQVLATNLNTPSTSNMPINLTKPLSADLPRSSLQSICSD